MNNRSRRRLRTLVQLAGVASVAVAMAIVGSQLSDDVIAVLAGVVCGVTAAIPASLLIVAASRRRSEENEQRAQQPPAALRIWR